ncbi:ZWICHEL kinesin-like calmodulin-binding protein, partial [Prunus dulcis]
CTLSNHLDQPTLESDFPNSDHRFRQYRSQTNHLTSLYQPCSLSASIRHCSSRKLPRNRPGPTVFPKICGARSPSFLNQIDRAVEVRGIHHRANYSFRAKGF